MKKFSLTFALSLFTFLQANAQSIIAGGFSHFIEVGRYSDYGKGYLTITDDHVIGIDDESLLSR